MGSAYFNKPWLPSGLLRSGLPNIGSLAEAYSAAARRRLLSLDMDWSPSRATVLLFRSPKSWWIQGLLRCFNGRQDHLGHLGSHPAPLEESCLRQGHPASHVASIEASLRVIDCSCCAPRLPRILTGPRSLGLLLRVES